MKKPTITAWLVALGKHLGSKAATAFVSFKSAELLLQAFAQELSKIPAGTKDIHPSSTAGVLLHMLEQLAEGANSVLTSWVVGVTILVAFVAGLAFCVGAYYDLHKPKSRALFAFSQRKIQIVEVLNLLIGKLVVPFTVICTMMYELSSHFSAEDKARAITIAVVVILFTSALHGVVFFGKQPLGAIIYTLTPQPNSTKLRESGLLDILASAIGTFPYVGKPEVQTETVDGTTLLVVPVRYPSEKWSKDDNRDFFSKLSEAESAWDANGYHIERFIPQNAKRNIPKHFQKPIQRKAA